MDIGNDIPKLLMRHAHVQVARLVGSRATADAHDFSDWDFLVETDDLAAVAQDLPVLVKPLRPLAQQWDRYADYVCYMLMLAGAVKVDFLFTDHPQDWAAPWKPSPDTLEAIDRHFWDWVVWIEQKRSGSHPEQVPRLFQDMHRLMLQPMGVTTRPTSITEAVTSYIAARDRLEQHYGVTVPRDLEDAVRPVVMGRQQFR
jgi:hypothetical protein